MPITKGIFYDVQSKVERDTRAELQAEREDFSGVECYFIENDFENENKLTKEKPNKQYTVAKLIRIIFDEKTGFIDGEKMISMFSGIEFSFGKKVFITKLNFEKMVGTGKTPKNLDVIYFPMMNRFFEVQEVKYWDTNWYSQGTCYTWSFELHTYLYSGETFSTGNTVIDNAITDNNPSNENNNQIVETENEEKHTTSDLTDKVDIDFEGL
jgi:hypothetical protein